MDTKKTAYELGFWFEILRSNDRVTFLTVETNSWIRIYPDRMTYVINELSQLDGVLDNIRQNVQDELDSILYHSDYVTNYAQVA